MKLMVFGIDALPPDIVFNNLDMFPNIKNIYDKGIHCEYDAYAYGYGSRDNWISLYTGLTPQQHGVIGNVYNSTGVEPISTDYKDKQPFWQVLSSNGIAIGMWKCLSTTPPEDINGYMISGEISYEEDADNNPYANLDPVVTEKDKDILNYIEGESYKQPIPKSAEDLGYSWDELLEDPSIINEILDDDYFSESIEYMKDNLEYFRKNILNVQKNRPVDVCVFYTQLIDYISHFQLHDKKATQVKKAIKLIDKLIGDVLTDIKPENVVIISDHGIKGWDSNFLGADLKMQKEMFGLKDEAIWLDNGSIVIRARNKGFLSAMHDIKGTFIACGDMIKSGKLHDMRTIDFYPTLLEMFDIDIPLGRDGFVLDIFKDKNITNINKVLDESKINSDKIAIIQNIEIPKFNTILNEVFLNNRFAHITVIGESKYKEAFLCNPRVDDIYLLEKKEIDRSVIKKYDKVFICYKNDMSKEIGYYQIK